MYYAYTETFLASEAARGSDGAISLDLQAVQALGLPEG